MKDAILPLQRRSDSHRDYDSEPASRTASHTRPGIAMPATPALVSERHRPHHRPAPAPEAVATTSTQAPTRIPIATSATATHANLTTRSTVAARSNPRPHRPATTPTTPSQSLLKVDAETPVVP